MKFVSEQVAQYKHHILSAKEIGKSLLLGTPDYSPFHQSIDAAQETLYYLNYLARAIHPSNGHAFVVQRSSFFSGHVPEHGTPTKMRKVASSSTTTRAQAEAERQHSEEEANFTSPQAKEVPSTLSVTTFTPGSGGAHDKYSPIEQDLYPQYNSYNVNIFDPVYNTKAKVATCPPTNTCYCGRVCSNPASLKSHHDRRHSQGDYECISCDYSSSNMRHTWKHHRTQHLYIHTHMCKVKGCKSGKDGKSPYGNDEQHTVWAHMYNAHNIQSPVSCPKCNAGSFSSKNRQKSHIATCEELEGKKTKQFGCDVVDCGKRYVSQTALDTHKAEARNPDKTEELDEDKYICEHCAKDFSTKGSLTRHIKRKHTDGN